MTNVAMLHLSRDHFSKGFPMAYKRPTKGLSPRSTRVILSAPPTCSSLRNNARWMPSSTEQVKRYNNFCRLLQPQEQSHPAQLFSIHWWLLLNFYHWNNKITCNMPNDFLYE
ncbi:hypothetical protein FKM82_010260 [Ascaphus truei]